MSERQISHHKLKLVVFDLDGTLTKPTSSWTYLHKKLGTWDKAREYSELFYTKKLTWNEWASKDAKLWAGIDVNEVKRIFQHCPLTDGVKPTVKQLKENGFAIVIVSGGVSFLAERVAKELKISHFYANRLQQGAGILTGEVKVFVTLTNKPDVIAPLLDQLELSPNQTVAVGDDYTMIPLFKIVGLSIAFNPSTVDVERSAHVVVRNQNLFSILPYIVNRDE